MKERRCDKCDKLIMAGRKYLKVSESSMKKNVQKLNHISDLCFTCWEDIKEKKIKK